MKNILNKINSALTDLFNFLIYGRGFNPSHVKVGTRWATTIGLVSFHPERKYNCVEVTDVSNGWVKLKHFNGTEENPVHSILPIDIFLHRYTTQFTNKDGGLNFQS